jgi:hypothetical protein
MASIGQDAETTADGCHQDEAHRGKFSIHYSVPLAKASAGIYAKTDTGNK